MVHLHGSWNDVCIEGFAIFLIRDTSTSNMQERLGFEAGQVWASVQAGYPDKVKVLRWQ